MKTLKDQIRDGEIGSLYLLFGEEWYLVQMNLQRLRRAVMAPEDEMMNLDESADIHDPEGLSVSIDTFPFMAERRMVLLSETGAFAPKKKEEEEEKDDRTTQELIRILSNIPETTTVVFAEKQVDKRSKLYKTLNSKGCALEYKKMEQKDLLTWMRSLCKKLSMKMADRELAYLISLVGSDMARLESELQKLSAFAGERREVTKAQIDALVTPSVEVKVFAMTDAISEGKRGKAYEVYKGLRQQGEAVQYIRYMINRHFRLMYRASLLEGADVQTVMQELDLKNSYPASSYMRQAKRFGKERLKAILLKLMQLDEDVKLSRMDEETAIELILLSYI